MNRPNRYQASFAIFAALAAASCTPSQQSKVTPAIAPDKDLEALVEKKLSELTLEEKVGQMCELTIDAVTDWSSSEFALSDSLLDVAFNRYKLGSLLNVPRSEAQVPSVWVNTIRKVNRYSYDACRGVTELYGVDQNHGSTYTEGGTLFPQEINQGASFNRDIVRRISEITAYESRACLIPWVYNPVMDLGRQPLWPRMWESYGEDVLVNAEMGVASVLGYQGNDPNHLGPNNVAVSLKHYMGYGVPINGKDRTPSSITDREMREKFFEPFRRCAEAGALSVMVNSSVNNGLSFHANKKMIQGWLKDELGWDGMVVSDWGDIKNVCSRDHIAATDKDAIELCVNAGVDMSMVPYDISFCDKLIELVNEGRVSRERIDDAARRILRLKYRLNLMDPAEWDMSADEVASRYPKFGSKEYDEEAERMTEECIVLLRNDTIRQSASSRLAQGKAILPLQPGVKILVTGPNANSFRSMNGGWSYSWQGNIADDVCRRIGKYKTFYEAISERFGAQNVRLVEGVSYAKPGEMDPVAGWDSMSKQITWESESRPNIEAAVAAARQSDVIIAFIGENSYTETVGNMNDLSLSANQQELVKALAKTGKPIILVLNEGRPRIIRDIEPLATATIDAMLPANYGGVALANLIAGDANFSARLPFTYPRHPASLETYDYKPCQNRGVMEGNYNYDAVMDVLYPFGSGLSYTHFEYSNLRVDKTSFTADDILTFSVDVRNTGDRAGKEPVLLFTSDLVASITPDIRRLRAFDKIELQPGQSQTVTLKVKASDLAFVGLDEHWVLEAGDFVATCGGLHVELSCSATKRWETPNRD